MNPLSLITRPIRIAGAVAAQGGRATVRVLDWAAGHGRVDIPLAWSQDDFSGRHVRDVTVPATKAPVTRALEDSAKS